MPTYWDDFINKNKEQLPYWTIQEILERFYSDLEKVGKISQNN